MVKPEIVKVSAEPATDGVGSPVAEVALVKSVSLVMLVVEYLTS